MMNTFFRSGVVVLGMASYYVGPELVCRPFQQREWSPRQNHLRGPETGLRTIDDPQFSPKPTHGRY